MRIKNLTIYSDDAKFLSRLSEEYTSIGFDNLVEDDKITIFAIPRKAKSRKQKRKEMQASKRQFNKV